VTLKVETEDGFYTVETDWLIAADGARSPIRRMLGLEVEGKIFMDAVPVTMPELSDRLQQKKAEMPDVPVIVRGDGTTQYQHVIDVLALLGELDITQLGLVTQKLVK
jgi:biopolymer transport protein ExbD